MDDLRNFTIPQLKEYLRLHQIKFSSNDRKADLRQLAEIFQYRTARQQRINAKLQEYKNLSDRERNSLIAKYKKLIEEASELEDKAYDLREADIIYGAREFPELKYEKFIKKYQNLLDSMGAFDFYPENPPELEEDRIISYGSKYREVLESIIYIAEEQLEMLE